MALYVEETVHLTVPKEFLKVFMGCGCDDLKVDVDVKETISTDDLLNDETDNISTIDEGTTLSSINLMMDEVNRSYSSRLDTWYLDQVIDQLTYSNEEFSFKDLPGIIDTLKNHKLEALSYMINKSLAATLTALFKSYKFTRLKLSLIAKKSAIVLDMWTNGLENTIRNNKELMNITLPYYPKEVIERYFSVWKDLSLEANKLLQVDPINMSSSGEILSRDLVDLKKRVNETSVTDLRSSKKYGSLDELGYTSGSFLTLHMQMVGLLKSFNVSSIMNSLTDKGKAIANQYDRLNTLVTTGKLTSGSDEYKSLVDKLERYSAHITLMAIMIKDATDALNSFMANTYRLYSRLKDEAEELIKASTSSNW